jgi:benzylsuccinate CoA-transferase BbsF subunit
MTESPLAGLRVLDFCWVGAGAFVTKMLADHGAEVVKIESRARPDNLRVAPPFRPGAEGLEGSGYFASRNTSKRSFALNMSHPDALAIARRLADRSDIVTSNFRPGIMARWGLTYEELRTTNPGLIYLTMPMQGADGPRHRYVGFGSTIAALAGLVAPSAEPGRGPVGTGTHYPDHVPNPGHGLVVLLAAILHRRRTGQGRAIELSQLESTVNLVGPGLMAYSADGQVPRPAGNRVPDRCPNGVFATRGKDRWIAISVADDAGWAALAEALDLPGPGEDARFRDHASRKRHEDALESEIEARTRVLDGAVLAEALAARGVAAAVVMTAADLLEDPQLEARSFWRRLEHPVMGTIVNNRAPFRADGGVGGPRTAAPLLGQDTREICRTVLGMADDEFERLEAAKVLY